MMQQMTGLKGALTRLLSTEVLIRIPGFVTYQRPSVMLRTWCPLQFTRQDISTLGRPVHHSGESW